MTPAEELMLGLIQAPRGGEGLHRVGKDGLIYPYICPAGYPTQGWGLLVESMAVPPITPDEADRRVRGVLSHYLGAAIRQCPALALGPPERLAAVGDWVFNLGEARLRASTMRRRINADDWPAACEEMLKWVNGGGRKLPGLVYRRQNEVALIRRTL